MGQGLDVTFTQLKLNEEYCEKYNHSKGDLPQITRLPVFKNPRGEKVALSCGPEIQGPHEQAMLGSYNCQDTVKLHLNK